MLLHLKVTHPASELPSEHGQRVRGSGALGKSAPGNTAEGCLHLPCRLFLTPKS